MFTDNEIEWISFFPIVMTTPMKSNSGTTSQCESLREVTSQNESYNLPGQNKLQRHCPGKLGQ